MSRTTSVIRQTLGSSLVGLSVLLIFCSFVKKPSGWCETLKCDGGEQKNIDIQSSALGFAVPGSGLTMHCGRFPSRLRNSFVNTCANVRGAGRSSSSGAFATNGGMGNTARVVLVFHEDGESSDSPRLKRADVSCTEHRRGSSLPC